MPKESALNAGRAIRPRKTDPLIASMMTGPPNASVSGAAGRGSLILRFRFASRRRLGGSHARAGLGHHSIIVPDDSAGRQARPARLRRREPPVFIQGGRSRDQHLLAACRCVGHIGGCRRRGRVAEGGGLLNRYRVVKLYRGFESLRLRQKSRFSHRASAPSCTVCKAARGGRGWRSVPASS